MARAAPAKTLKNKVKRPVEASAMTKADAARWDKQGTLHAKVLEMLRNDPRTLPEIFRDTGIPFFWLKKFVNGNIPQPSANRLQNIYEHLTGKKLKV